MNDPVQQFFTDHAMRARELVAGNYQAAVTCADEGRRMQGAPVEYMTRLLVYRVHALARLGRSRCA